MNSGDWKSTTRNAAAYQRDVEAFFSWRIRGGFDPQVIVEARAAEERIAREIAERIAERMVTGVLVTSAHSWRSAAAKSSKGRLIFAALNSEMKSAVGRRVNELIQANAARIQSLPYDLARRASRFIASEQRRGTRAAAIAATLQRRMPEMAQSQARMLARTGVGAAETALTRARAERLGLSWYDWATSEDQRVRPSHRLMDKVLVSWTDPPSPEQLAGLGNPFGHYAPGTVPNCRCLALPLIDLNEVRWPHKVYFDGHIAMMSRAQFEAGLRLPNAA